MQIQLTVFASDAHACSRSAEQRTEASVVLARKVKADLRVGGEVAGGERPHCHAAILWPLTVVVQHRTTRWAEKSDPRSKTAAAAAAAAAAALLLQ